MGHTTRAACEALVVIYIAHCLACIRRANDRVSTVQTLPYISRTKYIQNLLCLSNNQQCYFNSDTESVLDAICYFTGFISSECCILVMCDTDCQLLVSIWAYISGVQVRGLRHSKGAPRTQKLKMFTFSRSHCAKVLCVGSSRSVYFAPFSDCLCQFWGNPKFCPQKRFPKFPKFLGVGMHFLIALNGDPQGPPGTKTWQLYLGPFLQKKNSEILFITYKK